MPLTGKSSMLYLIYVWLSIFYKWKIFIIKLRIFTPYMEHIPCIYWKGRGRPAYWLGRWEGGGARSRKIWLKYLYFCKIRISLLSMINERFKRYCCAANTPLYNWRLTWNYAFQSLLMFMQNIDLTMLSSNRILNLNLNKDLYIGPCSPCLLFSGSILSRGTRELFS